MYRGAPLLARQGPPVVTQTITKPFTTFTAYVTLGRPPPSPSPTTDQETTTAEPFPTQQTSLVAPAGDGQGQQPGLTQEQVGAILGSIVAFVIICLVICFCASSRLSRTGRRARLLGSETTSETSSSWTEVTMRPRRSGGHDPWRNHARRWPPGRQPMPGQMFGQVQHEAGPRLNPRPPQFPPAARPAHYRQTPDPQIRGVRRFP